MMSDYYAFFSGLMNNFVIFFLAFLASAWKALLSTVIQCIVFPVWVLNGMLSVVSQLLVQLFRQFSSLFSGTVSSMVLSCERIVRALIDACRTVLLSCISAVASVLGFRGVLDDVLKFVVRMWEDYLSYKQGQPVKPSEEKIGM